MSKLRVEYLIPDGRVWPWCVRVQNKPTDRLIEAAAGIDATEAYQQYARNELRKHRMQMTLMRMEILETLEHVQPGVLQRWLDAQPAMPSP